MNQNPSPTNPHAPAAGLSLDDIVYTLFRHYRLILAFVCLGIASAVGVRLVKPPKYKSQAKLMLQYVKDTRPVTASENEAQSVKTVDPGLVGILLAEADILTSLDVATQTVTNVGPAKILMKPVPGDAFMTAAGIVASGIEVEPPRSAIINVSFRHSDPDVAQLVLGAVIGAYMQQHGVVHQGIGVADDYYRKLADQSREKLSRTEEELKTLKLEAKVLNTVEETKRYYQTEITKIEEELRGARLELAKRKALTGNPNAEGTNGNLVTIPPEKLDEYSEISSELEGLRRKQGDLLASGYTEAYPLVQTVRARINKLNKQKSELEHTYSALSALGSIRGRTNAPGGDLVGDWAEVRSLSAGVVALENERRDRQKEALHLMELEPKILEAQRRHDEQQKVYDNVVATWEQLKRGESQAAGKANNISIVQSPTPAALDMKKTRKLLAMVLAGWVAMGLGLAFLIELFIDRSIKRSSDVERHLHLPVFLTIPDTSWVSSLRLPWPFGRTNGHPDAPAQDTAKTEPERTELVQYQPGIHMRPYAEGLRERLMSYFEAHGLNLKKPKLVAVTGCAKGAGVSTLASGLAAELSKTGDGNVLLVDMNGEQGMAHSFYKGKPGCGLSDALEPETRGDAQLRDNLYLASLRESKSDALAKVMPNRFVQMVPKLKASDYDYIIFDMPPVSPMSSTPRLASHMDLVLLVLEAEKTGQQVAARANALMRESRANVAAVLNKHRAHVPTPLAQDA
jgi:polysaccharide biosynthesis transport protein